MSASYRNSGKKVELESGQEYYLKLKQNSGMPNYTISIGIPQAVIDITGNRIEHILTYEGQTDRYLYTAPVTGRYRLNFFIDDSTCAYKTKIYEQNNEFITSENSFNAGKTIDLIAGKTYQIVIEQTSGFTGYNIEICAPNEQKQILYNIINGSIWYVNQIDSYTYIAPETGKYRFDFGSNNVNNNYNFKLYDSGDNNILVNENFYSNGKNVNLEAGRKYVIQIQQLSGTEEYTINIGVPQPTKWVEGNSISGKITYNGQEDTYQYMAPISGKYMFEFDTSDVQCKYQVEVYSEKNESLMSATDGYKNKSVQLEAGQIYTVKVIQKNGYVEYRINIGVTEN